MKQQIRLNEGQFNELVRQAIMESVDEGRFGNFFSSLGQGALGTIRGGLDQGRQMYNQTMADKSQADSNAAAERSNNLAQQMNYGYSQIPACQKISANYDQKINKLQAQIQQLTADKKTALAQAKREYMSKTGKAARAAGDEASAYGDRAASAGGKATAMLNRRRNSLGFGNVDQAQEYGRKALEESIKRNIRMALKESCNEWGLFGKKK